MNKKMLRWLNKNRFLNLNNFQWVIPLFLSAAAIIFELIEHGIEGKLDISLISEFIIFGLTGPLVVGFFIAWMRKLVNAEKEAIAEVHLLNRELELKVAERTIALEERNIELAHANDELQQLDELKSEFVSLVSHELRAPLTSLNGGLELALQNAEALPPQSRRTLEMMVGESARLTNLVQTILDLSRLEAGKLVVHLGPVALRPLMEQAASVVLIPKGRSIEWEFTPDLPPVLADEIHLDGIIRNLMRNAEKYSQPNSIIHLCACQDDRKIRISVKDHGPGIPVENQSYIFDRFRRGNWERGESATPGWGLGLYFARKLIEAQDGTIDVRSPIWPESRSPGAEFLLILPVADFREE